MWIIIIICLRENEKSPTNIGCRLSSLIDSTWLFYPTQMHILCVQSTVFQQSGMVLVNEIIIKFSVRTNYATKMIIFYWIDIYEQRSDKCPMSKQDIEYLYLFQWTSDGLETIFLSTWIGWCSVSLLLIIYWQMKAFIWLSNIWYNFDLTPAILILPINLMMGAIEYVLIWHPQECQ